MDKNEKVEKFIKDLKDDAAVKYEIVRQKLIKDDFNLSLYEINLIASVFIYVREVWLKDIKKLDRAAKEAEGVIEKLTSAEREKWLFENSLRKWYNYYSKEGDNGFYL